VDIRSLTWNEFKSFVDGELAKRGYSGDERIWFIDISFPDKERLEDFISVGVDSNCGINIC